MVATPNRVTFMQLPSDQEASGRTLGEAELEMLREVIQSGTLTSTKGNISNSASPKVRPDAS